jgi:hypothetical protein
VLDGVVYLIAGATLIVWPGVVQTLFREEAFVGHEGALMRAIGMTIVLIGWLYVFGGRLGARQIVAASVIEPVAPELERIAALEDKKGFAEVVAYLHLLGTKPLFEADAVDECIRPPPFSLPPRACSPLVIAYRAVPRGLVCNLVCNPGGSSDNL